MTIIKDEIAAMTTGHAVPDATPLAPGKYDDIVGHEFAGHDLSDDDHPGKRWFCASHDQEGFWMYATDGSGHWTNVSGRAIGGSFHRIWCDEFGQPRCGWYINGRVPSYVKEARGPYEVITMVGDFLVEGQPLWTKEFMSLMAAHAAARGQHSYFAEHHTETTRYQTTVIGDEGERVYFLIDWRGAEHFDGAAHDLADKLATEES